jgi:hypothetical protein
MQVPAAPIMQKLPDVVDTKWISTVSPTIDGVFIGVYEPKPPKAYFTLSPT